MGLDRLLSGCIDCTEQHMMVLIGQGCSGNLVKVMDEQSFYKDVARGSDWYGGGVCSRRTERQYGDWRSRGINYI